MVLLLGFYILSFCVGCGRGEPLGSADWGFSVLVFSQTA